MPAEIGKAVNPVCMYECERERVKRERPFKRWVNAHVFTSVTVGLFHQIVKYTAPVKTKLFVKSRPCELKHVDKKVLGNHLYFSFSRS